MTSCKELESARSPAEVEMARWAENRKTRYRERDIDGGGRGRQGTGQGGMQRESDGARQGRMKEGKA